MTGYTADASPSDGTTGEDIMNLTPQDQLVDDTRTNYRTRPVPLSTEPSPSAGGLVKDEPRAGLSNLAAWQKGPPAPCPAILPPPPVRSGPSSAAPAQPQPQPSPLLLEHSRTTEPFVTAQPPLRDYQIILHRCRNRACPTCGPRLIAPRQESLAARIQEIFTNTLMLHLTIDPGTFPDPAAAYRHVAENRCTAKLAQDLRRANVLISPHWYAALDFNAGAEGWPHWHVLVDSHHIPTDLLLRLWGKQAPRACGSPAPSSMGHVWVSREQHVVDWRTSCQKAANYAIKYPPAGCPDWLLAMRRVRWELHSRGFWGSSPDKPDSPPPPRRKRGPNRKQTRPSRTYGEMLDDCGATHNLFEVHLHVDPQTGRESITRRWEAEAKLPAELTWCRLHGAYRRSHTKGGLPILQSPSFSLLLESLGRLSGDSIEIIKRREPPVPDPLLPPAPPEHSRYEPSDTMAIADEEEQTV